MWDESRGKVTFSELLKKTTMDRNARHSIVEIIFHNNPVKWKDDKNDDGRVG